jgi:hypothetical protein
MIGLVIFLIAGTKIPERRYILKGGKIDFDPWLKRVQSIIVGRT